MHFETKTYSPIIDVSQFWARNKDFVALDEDLENKTQNVTFEFNTYWIWKFMLEKQMGQANSMYEEWGIENSSDELKVKKAFKFFVKNRKYV